MIAFCFRVFLRKTILHKSRILAIDSEQMTLCNMNKSEFFLIILTSGIFLGSEVLFPNKSRVYLFLSNPVSLLHHLSVSHTQHINKNEFKLGLYNKSQMCRQYITGLCITYIAKDVSCNI